MADIKYYTVAFRDAGTPKTGLSATIDALHNAADGTSLTPVPTVTEIGSGLYRFSLDWDDAGYTDVNEIVLRVDSNDGTMSDTDRYIFGTISRRDSDSIYSLTDVQILGDWVIETNQLKLYKSDGTLMATFDLFDINGSPTSTSATTRIKV